jgi:hypothetical protein
VTVPFRGLRERGARDLIMREASRVFGLERELIVVEAARYTGTSCSTQWRVVVTTLMKPWTRRGGELSFWGRTKGDALDDAFSFFSKLKVTP